MIPRRDLLKCLAASGVAAALLPWSAGCGAPNKGAGARTPTAVDPLQSEPIDQAALLAALASVLSGTSWASDVPSTLAAWEALRAGIVEVLPTTAALMSCGLNDLALPFSNMLAELCAAPPTNRDALAVVLARYREGVYPGLDRLTAILPSLRDEVAAGGLASVALQEDDLPELRRAIEDNLAEIGAGVDELGIGDDKVARLMFAATREVTGQVWRGEVDALLTNTESLSTGMSAYRVAARARRSARQAVGSFGGDDDCGVDDEIKFWLMVIGIIIMIMSFSILVAALALGPIGMLLDAVLVTFLSGGAATTVIYYFAMAIVLLQIGMAGVGAITEVANCACAAYTGQE